MDKMHFVTETSAKNCFLPYWLSLLSLVIALSCFSSASAKSNTIKCLELQQTHVYLNKIRVLLSPQAVRLEGRGKFRFVVIARAPKWEVTAFRTDDKYSYSQPFNDFCDQGLYSHMVLPERTNMIPPGAVQSVQKVSGFPITRLSYQSIVLRYMDNTVYGTPQTVKFLHSALRVPTQKRIPISFEQELSGRDWMTHVSQEGLRREFLNTQSIALKDFPASEFAIPQGLVQAKSMTRIIAGDARKMEDTGVDQIILH